MLKPLRIGELLRDRGLVEDAHLAQSLARQEALGDRLGDVLTGEGYLRPRELYEALAEQQGMEYADLVAVPPQAALLDAQAAQDYLRYRCIPWQCADGVMKVACSHPTERRLAYMESLAAGYKLEIVLATPRDIVQAIEHACAHPLDVHAREHLLRRYPQYSLRRGLLKMGAPLSKRGKLPIILGALLGLALWFPALFLPLGLMLCNLLYLVSMGFKLVLFWAGRAARLMPTPAMLADLPAERDLPIYTVLVPLYQEAETLPQLITALAAIDYPKTRLDIKLIVEADDAKTLAALRALKPPAYCELLRVPYSLPRTKPKACNFALAFARGEFVTIYDAEDIPAPDQLKKAVAAFRALPPEVICLQARLNYYNRHENLLTRLFAIEYSGLFDFLLPGLQALGVPIPLGGTSNHLRLSRLRELGEWDPYNVTEDADLGIRLATEGHSTMLLDSLTEEEAPVVLSAWLKQRSRWIKGYMQTWRVAMRHAPLLVKRFGLAGFIGFQLFVGAASLIYLLAPLLWLVALLWITVGLGGAAERLPSGVQIASVGVLSLGIVIQWALALLTIREAGWKGAAMVLATLLYPFYWFLHSLASFRALWQLVFAPYFWDKTPHGLSRYRLEKNANEA